MPEKKLNLSDKLLQCDAEIQNFVSALKTENRKFQRKIAKLQAENITLQNCIDILEEENPEKGKYSELDLAGLLEKATEILERYQRPPKNPDKE